MCSRGVSVPGANGQQRLGGEHQPGLRPEQLGQDPARVRLHRARARAAHHGHGGPDRGHSSGQRSGHLRFQDGQEPPEAEQLLSPQPGHLGLSRW